MQTCVFLFQFCMGNSTAGDSISHMEVDNDDAPLGGAGDDASLSSDSDSSPASDADPSADSDVVCMTDQENKDNEQALATSADIPLSYSSSDAPKPDDQGSSSGRKKKRARRMPTQTQTQQPSSSREIHSVIRREADRLGWPDGPKTMAEAAEWPKWNAKRLFEPGVHRSDRIESFGSVLAMREIIIHEAYAGSGNGAVSLHHQFRALADEYNSVMATGSGPLASWQIKSKRFAWSFRQIQTHSESNNMMICQPAVSYVDKPSMIVYARHDS